MKNQSGQTLIEFCAVCGLLIGLLVWMGQGLWEDWKQAQCVYQVFEAGHKSLFKMKFRKKRGVVRDTPHFVVSEAKCPFGVERLSFEKLN